MTYKPKLNLYFGLSPVQDAKQIAQRAWFDNNSPNAIMIIPNNSWGQNIGTAFQQQWQSLGGDIGTSKYSNRQDLHQQVKNSLLLRDSQLRIDSIENTIGKHVRGLRASVMMLI